MLHPRLRTGPGKSGLSRGVLALKNILDKFQVANRENMFVYRDVNASVFYLRLYENLQGGCGSKLSLAKSNEFEHSVVSRSPSITSLPLGHQRSESLAHSQHSITSSTSVS